MRMEVPVSEAKAHLLDLVRRAEAGEEVILTRRGAGVIRLVPVRRVPSADEKRALMAEIFSAGKLGTNEGPDAARSQDFLYDDHGLPG
jgi:prevent-host-death family protein